MPNPPIFSEVGVLALVPYHWDAQWMACNHILTRLAKYFHVVWMDPAREWHEVLRRSVGTAMPLVGLPPGFAVYRSPFWLPLIRQPGWLVSLTMRRRLELARRTLVRRGCKKIIIYLWRPQFEEALTCVPFDLSCYHIDDEYSFSTLEIPTPESETQLIAKVDQVFIHAPAMMEKKGKINPYTAFVPNGVDYEAHAQPREEPADLVPIPHPRVGYSGHIKKQLDWPLLLELTSRHSEWSFVFVGSVNAHPEILPAIQELSRRRNVYFLGGKTVRDLAIYPAHFDVCIMPYRRDDYTKYVYPLKLHEYLATGNPTVGTRIRTLEEFSDVVALPRTASQWSAALAEALSPAANTPDLRAARQSVARRNDWDIRVEEIAKTLVTRVVPELLARLPLAGACVSDVVMPALSKRVHPGRPIVRPNIPPEPVGSLKSVEADQSTAYIPSHATPSTQEIPPVGPVMLVCPWYRPAVGGVVEVAERLRRTLANGGVETHLFIPHGGGGGIQADPTAPNLWRLGSTSSAFEHLTFRSLLATLSRGPLVYWGLHQFVRSYRIKTIVLIYPNSCAWLFLLLRHTMNVSLIASLHGNDVTKFESYEAPMRWLIVQVLRTADAIIGCADHLVRKARELCPGRSMNLHLIPNCVDSTYFVPPPPNYVRTKFQPTFIHVSNFAAKKRTEDIVAAFADERIPLDARLVMVGDGPCRDAAIDQARSLGVSQRIEFVGMQSDVRPFLWEADVFVLASDDEGAPLSLLEAMACGLPWVSTAWGPAAILPPGECGLVVPPRSPRLLAAAMAELIKDPERRLDMARRARYRTQTDFREEIYVERHLQLIRSIQPQSAGGRIAQTNPRGRTDYQALANASVNKPQPITHEEVGRTKSDGR